ncbi:hypothetical protein GW17_00003918 [Ensete ventricosum]|nr:hypothetical protein GW17_00003918 [Ensete ventricosum]
MLRLPVGERGVVSSLHGKTRQRVVPEQEDEVTPRLLACEWALPHPRAGRRGSTLVLVRKDTTTPCPQRGSGTVGDRIARRVGGSREEGEPDIRALVDHVTAGVQYDKEFIVCSLDLLSGLVEGLGGGIESLAVEDEWLIATPHEEFYPRFAIPTCIARYVRYILVCQVTGTRTARYRVARGRLFSRARRRSVSLRGETDRGDVDDFESYCPVWAVRTGPLADRYMDCLLGGTVDWGCFRPVIIGNRLVTVDFDRRRSLSGDNGRFRVVSADGGRKKRREKKRENLESSTAPLIRRSWVISSSTRSVACG